MSINNLEPVCRNPTYEVGLFQTGYLTVGTFCEHRGACPGPSWTGLAAIDHLPVDFQRLGCAEEDRDYRSIHD